MRNTYVDRLNSCPRDSRRFSRQSVTTTTTTTESMSNDESGRAIVGRRGAGMLTRNQIYSNALKQSHIPRSSSTSMLKAKELSIPLAAAINRPMVLHGRVVYHPPEEESNPTGSTNHLAYHTFDQNFFPSSRTDSMTLSTVRSSPSTFQPYIRESMERRSIFCKLKEEVQRFHRQVETLKEEWQTMEEQCTESVFSAAPSRQREQLDSSSSPQEAWRLRILVKSAMDTDKTLSDELFQYERTLQHDQLIELRQEQMDCMKLHRDFKGIHKDLIMCLSQIEENRGKNDTLHHLGGVGWTGLKPDEPIPVKKMEEDELLIVQPKTVPRKRVVFEILPPEEEIVEIVKEKETRSHYCGNIWSRFLTLDTLCCHDKSSISSLCSSSANEESENGLNVKEHSNKMNPILSDMAFLKCRFPNYPTSLHCGKKSRNDTPRKPILVNNLAWVHPKQVTL